MKEAAKVFATIASLLLGALFVLDFVHDDYSAEKQLEATVGVVLLAAGLTAIWIRRARKG
jgi:hypothetical protein